jgi:hypothetical protein
MFSQITFRIDEQGRAYYDEDTQQLRLLGVDRIYHRPVPDPYGDSTARFLHGQYHIPEDTVRRPGIAYISRQGVESALWRLRHRNDRIDEARALLLARLLFDTSLPYEVFVDPIRDLYAFVTVAAGPAHKNPPLT